MEIRKAMRKITDMLLDSNKEDPSKEYEEQLKELILQMKISMISYQDDPDILYNIYSNMKVYLSDAVVNDIIESCLTNNQFKVIHRDMMINFILKT